MGHRGRCAKHPCKREGFSKSVDGVAAFAPIGKDGGRAGFKTLDGREICHGQKCGGDGVLITGSKRPAVDVVSNEFCTGADDI